MVDADAFLSTPSEYATPNAIASARQMAAAMMNPPTSQYGGTGAAIGNALSKLAGAWMLNTERAREMAMLRGGAAQQPALGNPAGATAGMLGGPPAQPPALPTASMPPAQGAAGGGAAHSLAGNRPTDPVSLSGYLETGSTDPMRSVAAINYHDSHGSHSYGTFGLSSLPGSSAWQFRQTYGQQLGLTAAPGTREFDQQWLNAAHTNPQALHQAERMWYSQNVLEPTSQRLAGIGIPQEAASDPRAQAYYADRQVQQGSNIIQQHAARIQHAWQQGGGTVEGWLRAQSAQDLDPRFLAHDFKTALNTNAYSAAENNKRVTGRLEGALGIQPPQQALSGAPGGAPGPQAMLPGQQQAPGGMAQPTKFTDQLQPGGGQTGGMNPLPVSVGGGVQAMPPSAMNVAAGTGNGSPPSAATGNMPIVQDPRAMLPKLPSDEQIQALIANPMYHEQGLKLLEEKKAAMAPQMIETPTGQRVMMNPYMGAYDTGIASKPLIDEFKMKIGDMEFRQPAVLTGNAQQGFQFNRIPVQSGQAEPGQAGFQRQGFQPVSEGGFQNAGGPQQPGLNVDPRTGYPLADSSAMGPPATGSVGGAGPMPDPFTSTPGALVNWSNRNKVDQETRMVSAREQTTAREAERKKSLEAGVAAPQQMQDLMLLQDFYKQPHAPGGPLGAYDAKFRSMLNEAFGQGTADGVPASELIGKMNTLMSFRAVQETIGSRPALAGVIMQTLANPGLKLNDRTSLYLINVQMQQAMQNRQVGMMANEVSDPADFIRQRDEFFVKNPIRSPIDGRPLTTAEALKEDLNKLADSNRETRHGVDLGIGHAGDMASAPKTAPAYLEKLATSPGQAGAGQAQQPQTQQPQVPAIGEVRRGYRFKGGEPHKPESWEKMQ